MAKETQPVRRRVLGSESKQDGKGAETDVTRKDLDITKGEAEEALAAAEKQKVIDANSRTSEDPEDAKDIDPAEAERFERAVQERAKGDGTPLPQRKIPTDNSLPNSDAQYIVPRDAEIEDLEESADVETSPMAAKQAKDLAARRDKEREGGKTAKYIVSGGSIHTTEGKVREGEVANLTAAEAKHFNKLGRLRPYIPE